MQIPSSTNPSLVLCLAVHGGKARPICNHFLTIDRLFSHLQYSQISPRKRSTRLQTLYSKISREQLFTGRQMFNNTSINILRSSVNTLRLVTTKLGRISLLHQEIISRDSPCLCTRRRAPESTGSQHVLDVL